MRSKKPADGESYASLSQHASPGYASLLEEWTRSPPEILSEKLELLRQDIGRLKEQIVARKALHQKAREQLGGELVSLGTALESLRDMWRMGDNIAIEQRRSSLEHRLQEARQELRKQEVECWKDVAWLEGQLAGAVKEYQSLSVVLKGYGDG